MRRTRKIGFALMASALIVGPMSGTVASAATPTMTTVFSDDFNTPTTLATDTNWADPGSGYILPTSADGTPVLGFLALGSGGDVFSVHVPIVAGHTYNMQTDYATDADSGFLGVDEYSASDVFIGEQWVLGGDSTSAGQLGTMADVASWGTYNHNFTPDAGTAYVVVEVEDFAGSTNLAGYGPGAYFDNIVLSMLNYAPSVTDTTVTTPEDTPTTVDLSALANDPESDALTYTVLSGPSHGTLGTITAGHVDYVPAANYNNTVSTPDTFTFKATDAFGADSNTGTVSVVVTPVPDPSNVTNLSPSRGVFTNKKTTVVFHALVTSTDPACTIGRAVTFNVQRLSDQTESVLTVLTDGSGLASAKFPVTLSAYKVAAAAPPTDACLAGKDVDTYDFSTGK